METINNEFWQFNIIFNKKHYDYFKEVFVNLKQNDIFINAGGVVCLEADRLLIAVKREYETKVKSILKAKIIKILTENYKFDYFLSNIAKLDLLGKLKPIFLKVLTMFDSEQEILQVEKYLRLNDTLYLNEFFYFKLKDLQKKWKEICDMTNDNSFFFTTDSLVFELIRFLLNSSKPKKDFLTINILNDKFYLLDENNNQIYEQNVTDDYENLIVKILDNYPKRIYLKNYEKLSRDMSNLMYSMFKNNLKPLYFA